MSDLDRLFYWRGIAPDFYSFNGELTPVSVEKRVQILRAMGVDTSSPEALAAEAFDLDIKPWLSWLPPLEVIVESHSVVEINFKPEELSEKFSWCICAGGEPLKQGVFFPKHLKEVGDYIHDGKRYSRRELPIGAHEPNYYTISLRSGECEEHTTLAIVPAQSYQPMWVDDVSANPWGFVVQLYTLRSVANWGIGDFSDLQSLIRLSKKYDVDIIGLNPFHALQSDLKHNFSPYAPSDRRFLNPLYIDVERAEGYEESFKPEREIELARAREHVDYDEMRSIKYKALFDCFERFILISPSILADFIEDHADGLVEFANYEALTSWQPEELVAHPVKAEALLDALRHPKQALSYEMQLIAFHCYLQWLAESQLAECQQLACDLGMKVGLVRDLAVGASGGGAEAQTNAQLFCRDAAIGAPPDPFSLTGQNWGIPPMDPAELRRTAFAHYINLLRANMVHCGALRIDHAMSLFRLWWCPAGQSAANGAYIYYPFKEMLGLLCLESHLNKCVVIAEDLGIVPDEFRNAMHETKLFSNKLFYFEKCSDTEFKPPQHYDRHALAMLDNHDVPTLTSWWNGSDLTLRRELNMFKDDAEFDCQVGLRFQEKTNLFSAIRENSFLPASWATKSVDEKIDIELMSAIATYVSGVNSQFYILQLEDLLLMNDPVNVPGTFLEHKNWSRKLNRNLDDIFSDSQISKLLASVAEARKKLKGE